MDRRDGEVDCPKRTELESVYVSVAVKVMEVLDVGVVAPANGHN